MRVDVISIFPEYLEPLGLSLVGKACAQGLIDVRVHDLREWAHDRHKTVDDTPYGGGAGMVMMPTIWGEAIDAVLAAGDGGGGGDGGAGEQGETVLVFPTPAGKLFNQECAQDLSAAGRLVFACGRYEGIDARVAEHYRRVPGVRVEELSLGDYVLAGGEVAALAMIEAVTRLLPGVLGNAESLVEESHGPEHLLEYPVYTKPPVWRGLEVPAVLLSGDHGAVERWRHERSVARTRQVRPDLLP
jgi:tRNA (guanine37-N1)-methyltransferase